MDRLLIDLLEKILGALDSNKMLKAVWHKDRAAAIASIVGDNRSKDVLEVLGAMLGIDLRTSNIGSEMIVEMLKEKLIDIRILSGRNDVFA